MRGLRGASIWGLVEFLLEGVWVGRSWHVTQLDNLTESSRYRRSRGSRPRAPRPRRWGARVRVRSREVSALSTAAEVWRGGGGPGPVEEERPGHRWQTVNLWFTPDYSVAA